MSFLASYRTFGNKLACIQTGGDFMDKPNDKFQAPNNKQYQSPKIQIEKFELLKIVILVLFGAWDL
jgi:hypothetical protein